MLNLAGGSGANWRGFSREAWMRLWLGAGVGALAALVVAQRAAAQQRIVFKLYFGDGASAVDTKAAYVIAKALPQIQKCEANGVRVVGHADTFRDAGGSSELATARARAVREALMTKGVRDSVIAWVGHSEAEPEVATADGVKEPQNDRVEIILVCD